VSDVVNSKFVGLDVEKVWTYVSGFDRVSSSVPCKHNPFQPDQDNPELPNCVSLQRYPPCFQGIPWIMGCRKSGIIVAMEIGNTVSHRIYMQNIKFIKYLLCKVSHMMSK
jgi:hypothetical protein